MILLAQINPIVGDLEGNTEKILNGIEIGRKKKAGLIIFPELSLSGYPPDDFLLMNDFIKSCENKLKIIAKATTGISVIVGTPRRNPQKSEKPLFNSACIISNGSIVGYQDKMLLPTYDVFDERRYFEPAAKINTFDIAGKKIGITICEDIWQHSGDLEFTKYALDPVKMLKEKSPDLIINLSASPFRMNKCKKRLEVCQKTAIFLNCPILLCNLVGGNDSLIFDGYSLSLNEKGELLAYAKGFEEDYLDIDLNAEPISLNIDETEDLTRALVLGIKDYFQKQNFKTAILGLSGGIDSALVACLATAALGKENVYALMMPSRFSSKSSLTDAEELIKNLGIKSETISIEGPFKAYLDLLEPHFPKTFDVAEENIQARIRGMILMAFSNKFGHIVLSNGNKSELAMGYVTLYGDMCGGLGVISDVSKMQVYELARWINREKEVIPKNTLIKPPSAELREGQKDSDTLPDYEIVDNVLTEYIEKYRSPNEIAKKYNYSLKLVEGLIKRIHVNEYKRRQSPLGLRVTMRAFSIGRRFPIVQKWV